MTPGQVKQMMAQYDSNQQYAAEKARQEAAQQAAAEKARQLGFASPAEHNQWATEAGYGDAAAGHQRIDQALAAAQQAGVPVDVAVRVMKTTESLSHDWDAIAARIKKSEP